MSDRNKSDIFNIFLEKCKNHNFVLFNAPEELRNNKIISGFRVFIDITKLGYSSSKIYLDINKLTTEEENDLTSFLSTKRWSW